MGVGRKSFRVFHNRLTFPGLVVEFRGQKRKQKDEFKMDLIEFTFTWLPFGTKSVQVENLCRKCMEEITTKYALAGTVDKLVPSFEGEEERLMNLRDSITG